jgi:DNA-binding CsgD family transcriptional regulator
MRTADLRRMLWAFGSVSDAGTVDELADAILSCVVAAVGAEAASVTPLEPRDRPSWPTWTWPAAFLSADELALFEDLHRQDPWILAAHTRHRSGTPMRISDSLSQRQYHGLTIYGELFRSLEIEHQVAFTFMCGGRPTCVTVNRHRRDFSDDELDCLRLLRLPLSATAPRVAGWGGAAPTTRPSDGLGLSHREGQVLSLVAAGLSNDQIGGRLGVSVRTVHKHLEHVLAKTATHNRTEAAVRWLQAGGSAGLTDGPVGR